MHTSLPAAALVAVNVFDVLLCARVVFFQSAYAFVCIFYGNCWTETVRAIRCHSVRDVICKWAVNKSLRHVAAK